MHTSKIHSTLTFTASNGDEFKYEIHQSLNNSSFYAVIYTIQEIDTERHGRCGTWVQINAHLTLDPVNALACEEECKKHFRNHHQKEVGEN